MDSLVQGQTYKLLKTMPTLLLLYVKYRQDEAACLAVWHKVLEEVARHTDEIEFILPTLLDAAESDVLPAYLKPQGEEMHEVAGALLTEAVSASLNAPQVVLVRRLLTSYREALGCHHVKSALTTSLTSAVYLQRVPREPPAWPSRCLRSAL